MGRQSWLIMGPVTPTVAATAIVVVAILRSEMGAIIAAAALVSPPLPPRTTILGCLSQLILAATHREMRPASDLATADMRLPFPSSIPPIMFNKTRRLPLIAMRLQITSVTRRITVPITAPIGLVTSCRCQSIMPWLPALETR